MDDTVPWLFSDDKNRRLTELAFDCLLLSENQKEEVLAGLSGQAEDSEPLTVLDIFRREKLVSDENIAFLIDYDAFLQTRHEDKKFGRIAVANGIAPEKEIRRALEAQKVRFNKSGSCVTVGEILVGDRVMSNEQRISILLTQNRIEGENLMDALGTLGRNRGQKDAVNKRFAAIVLRKKILSRKQVNAALETRQEEIRTLGRGRFLGQILVEAGGLSEADGLKVLREQAEIEKRLLDLENALYSAGSEFKIYKKLNELFEYSIEKGGVEAFVKKKAAVKEDICVYDMLIWMRRVGISSGILPDRVLEDFIRNAEPESRVLVARGTLPEPAVDETIEFYFQTDSACLSADPGEGGPGLDSPETGMDEEGEAPAEGKGDSAPQTPEPVEKNSLLAKIIPGKPGEPGRDVKGRTIYPNLPGTCPHKAGRNVIRRGRRFYSRISGQPLLKDYTLVVMPVPRMSPVINLSGSISEDTEDSYIKEDLMLRGGVLPGAVLNCRSLTLQGRLEGCVNCSGDLHARGPIGNPDLPEGGSDDYPTRIVCQGTVSGGEDIVHAKIQTEGELTAFRSKLVGSLVIARQGISIDSALGLEQRPTILQVGVIPGDRILAIDRTLELRETELGVLNREKELEDLKKTFLREMEQEKTCQVEHDIMHSLMKILRAPELERVNGLEEKIQHLFRLPDFSSIRTYYLNFPETQAAWHFIKPIISATCKMENDAARDYIQGRIDSAPELRPDRIKGLETEYNARRSAFEREIEGNSNEIQRLEKNIRELKILKDKLLVLKLEKMDRAGPVIGIKNKCEKGTIIKGQVSQIHIKEDIYHVKFREKTEPATRRAFISIENY